jgi:hypothetical protein
MTRLRLQVPEPKTVGQVSLQVPVKPFKNVTLALIVETFEM